MTALKALAKTITADWVAAFPDFDVYKPLWLLRRIGPVVQGIILDRTRSTDEYLPTSHVHALTRDFPTISLMLGQRGDRVSTLRHDRDYLTVAAKLREQSVLSLAAPPTIDDIVNAYQSFAISQKEKGFPPAVPEMEDSVLVSAIAGRSDLLAANLDLAAELAAVWPKSRLPLDWVSSDAWLNGLREKAADPAQLQVVVDGQIAKHKLAKIRAT